MEINWKVENNLSIQFVNCKWIHNSSPGTHVNAKIMKLNCPKFQGGSHLRRQGETIPTCNMAQSSITGSFPYLLLESQLDKLTLVLKLDFKYSHPSPKQREIYAKSLFLDTQILGWWIYTYLYQEVFSIKEKKGTLRFYNLFSKEKKKRKSAKNYRRDHHSFCSESKYKHRKEDWKFNIKKNYTTVKSKLTNSWDKTIHGRRLF